jgi:hypothetical protein
MVTLELREVHLVKHALAIAILAIERQSGPLQPQSDQHDMKVLFDRLASDMEAEHYVRGAWLAVTGQVPPSPPA